MNIKQLLKEKLDKTLEEFNEDSRKHVIDARPEWAGGEYDRPGGACWQEWDKFVSVYKPGDEFWSWTTSPKSWGSLAGRAGYAIVREGAVVSAYTTRMN